MTVSGGEKRQKAFYKREKQSTNGAKIMLLDFLSSVPWHMRHSEQS